MFNNFLFSKIAPFMRQRGKIMYSQTGHGGQYNTAHALFILLTFWRRKYFFSFSTPVYKM